MIWITATAIWPTTSCRWKSSKEVGGNDLRGLFFVLSRAYVCIDISKMKYFKKVQERRYLFSKSSLERT